MVTHQPLGTATPAVRVSSPRCAAFPPDEVHQFPADLVPLQHPVHGHPRVATTPQVTAPGAESGAARGSCRKSPGALYVDRGGRSSRHGHAPAGSTSDSSSTITSPSTLTTVCTAVCERVACPTVIPNDSLTSQNPAWLT